MVPFYCQLIDGILRTRALRQRPRSNTGNENAAAAAAPFNHPTRIPEIQSIVNQPIANQPNRAHAISTVEPVRKKTASRIPVTSDSDNENRSPDQVSTGPGRFSQLIEIGLIFVCFALYAGQLPPDVNESHYLSKAKHFWNPNWCPNDIFLGSSFAHWLFYVIAGGLTKFMSLSAVAWTGRAITWLLIAVAWHRLSRTLMDVRWVAVISAIFFLLLNDRFHLAGEWIIGGFEAKGIAYFFVLLALGSLVKRDWSWVWPLLGAACAFHILVGGWSFLSALFAWLATMHVSGHISVAQRVRDASAQWLPLAAGIALASIGAIPPLLADLSAPSEIAIAARSIYVNHRIAHHLSFDAFPALHVARFTLVILYWYLLSRWLWVRWPSLFRRIRPLFQFCIGSLIISFGGLLLTGLAEQNDRLAIISEGLLRFYWFRLSDVAVPLAAAMASCAAVVYWLKTDRRISTRVSSLVFVSCVLVASGVAVYQRHQDPRPRADRSSLPSYQQDEKRTLGTYRNWRKACQWVAENTPADAMFITPHEQQTFKWYAGRAEVVNWKDIPQDSFGIVEWSDRLRALYEPQRRYESGLFSYSDAQLRELARKYGAGFLMVPQRHVDLATEPTLLKQVYPADPHVKSTYVVFEF